MFTSALEMAKLPLSHKVEGREGFLPLVYWMHFFFPISTRLMSSMELQPARLTSVLISADNTEWGKLSLLTSRHLTNSSISSATSVKSSIWG